MKVQITQQQNKPIQKSPQFKGGVDTALRFLATNQGVGANLTDVSFMVVPRILSDAQRGPSACVETARREASGTANHSSVGIYGLAGGMAAAGIMGINRKFGTDANSIFAAPETINILAENKANQFKNKTTQLDYLKETLKNVKAYNPTAKNADKKGFQDGFIKLSENTIDEVAKILDNAINDKNMNFKTWKKQDTHNSLNVAVNKIIEDTGAESQFILESADKKIKSNTSLRTLLEDIYKVSESFNKEKVKEAFENQIKENKTIADNTFVKKLSKFMKIRSGVAFVAATAIGMSIQPLNIYLTKLKTGSDGFVGVEGRTKDKSTEFKAMKGVSALAFGGLVLGTLGTGLKGFMDKMAFKGFWPTINQLKGIYGLTIISRILSTRDKDELREALTKDTLGFLSWLVLGDIVNKATADRLDKSVMNYKNGVDNTKTFKRIFNASLKTRDEILVETLAQNNIKTTYEKDGKVVAKKFSAMLKDLENSNIADSIKKTARKRLNTLTKAQVAGYAFSGLVLGLGIPNLNIYITNTLDKKRKAAAQKNKQV